MDVAVLAVETVQKKQKKLNWFTVCPLETIISTMGVAVFVADHQIAVFRLADDRVFAISNYDPFSKAFVLSRGIVGDRNGEVKVASPIYKQSFSLLTGKCLDDPSIQLETWPVCVMNGCVEIGL
jgi:nitrite reductase (NADH) small subunit